MSNYFVDIGLGILAVLFLFFRFFGEKLGIKARAAGFINIFLALFLLGILAFHFYSYESYIGLFALFLGFLALLKVAYDKMN